MLRWLAGGEKGGKVAELVESGSGSVVLAGGVKEGSHAHAEQQQQKVGRVVESTVGDVRIAAWRQNNVAKERERLTVRCSLLSGDIGGEALEKLQSLCPRPC